MATVNFSSITIEQLQALEQAIYADILERNLTRSYSVRDQMFTFDSITEAREFLGWIQAEIAKRQTGGGFSLARFVGVS